jgi:hypothetical protein
VAGIIAEALLANHSDWRGSAGNDLHCTRSSRHVGL